MAYVAAGAGRFRLFALGAICQKNLVGAGFLRIPGL